MAVNRIHSIEKYIGLSTDTKPNALIGSEFYEQDTKNTYVVYAKIAGVSQWVLK